jgi:hypothetical protein
MSAMSTISRLPEPSEPSADLAGSGKTADGFGSGSCPGCLECVNEHLGVCFDLFVRCVIWYTYYTSLEWFRLPQYTAHYTRLCCKYPKYKE